MARGYLSKINKFHQFLMCRNVATKMSRDRHGQTESVRPKRPDRKVVYPKIRSSYSGCISQLIVCEFWVSTFSTTEKKTNGNLAKQRKHNFYKRWRHQLRHKGPSSKNCPAPLHFNPALTSATTQLGLRFAATPRQLPDVDSGNHFANLWKSSLSLWKCAQSLEPIIWRIVIQKIRCLSRNQSCVHKRFNSQAKSLTKRIIGEQTSGFNIVLVGI